MRAYCLTILTVLSFAANGQVAKSLYFMDNIPQSNILNPAFEPNYNFYIGLPIINQTSFNFSSDISFGDLYSDGNWMWNSSELFNAFVEGAKETSYMQADVNTNLFSLGFKIKESGYFHFAVNQRAEMSLGIPKSFFELTNLTIDHDLSDMQASMQWYNEYTFAYSHAINDKLTVGARLKYLAGVACAELNFNTLDFNTTQEAWSYQLDGELNISGPIDVTTSAEGFPENFDLDVNTSDYQELMGVALANFGNSGFGIDLGAEYELMDKLNLSASLTDLGRISWKDGLSNYHGTADYEFTGIEDAIVAHGDDGVLTFNNTSIDAIADSLKDATIVTEGSDGFVTHLSPKLYIGAEYEFTNVFSVGVLSKTRFEKSEVRQGFSLHGNANFTRVLTLGLNYNLELDSRNSLGGVVGLRLTPFYIYAATNFVTKPSSNSDLSIVLPTDFSAANVQFGINFVLGNRYLIAKKAKEEAAGDLSPVSPL